MIHTVPEIASTNGELAAWLRAGEQVPEGFWLVADRQTAGKGRQNRAWFDGAGNFMGSTVVYPAAGDPPPSSLALVAGLAVQQAAASLLPEGTIAQLKWPNDVMIGLAKLAGILLEARGSAVIVGIGVNLAIAPRLLDRKTISLADVTETPSRDAFAEILAARVSEELAAWRAGGIAQTITRWCAAAHPEGTPLSVGEPGESPLVGTFAGLDPNGALQLRLPDGTTRVIHAGDVRLA